MTLESLEMVNLASDSLLVVIHHYDRYDVDQRLEQRSKRGPWAQEMSETGASLGNN